MILNGPILHLYCRLENGSLCLESSSWFRKSCYWWVIWSRSMSRERGSHIFIQSFHLKMIQNGCTHFVLVHSPGPSSTPVVERALYWSQGQILTLIWNQKVHNIPSCNILGNESFIGISQTWPQFFIYKTFIGMNLMWNRDECTVHPTLSRNQLRNNEKVALDIRQKYKLKMRKSGSNCIRVKSVDLES